MASATKIEEEIVSKSLFRDLVTPAYNRYSIVSLVTSILKHFHINFNDHQMLPKPLFDERLEGARKIVLFVIDSLGYLQLKDVIRRSSGKFMKPILEKFSPIPLTSTFPSTTTTALTTCNTGRSPGEHGIIGTSMYIRQLGTVANILDFSPALENRRDVLLEAGLDLQAFLGYKTVYEIMNEEGVSSSILIRRFHKNTGLSKMLNSGANVIPYVNSSDMLVTLRKILENDQEGYIFVYWDALDGISHTYGPFSEECRAEVEDIFFQLKKELFMKIDNRTARNIGLIVIGDHGQIDANPQDTIVASEHPHLTSSLMIPPTGDSRAAFLYPKEGRSDYVIDYLHKKFSQVLFIVNSEEALKRGLFGRGKVKDSIHEKIGRIIVLPKNGVTFHYPYKKMDQGYFLKGAHAGLSREEMLIPYLSAKLSDAVLK